MKTTLKLKEALVKSFKNLKYFIPLIVIYLIIYFLAINNPTYIEINRFIKYVNSHPDYNIVQKALLTLKYNNLMIRIPIVSFYYTLMAFIGFFSIYIYKGFVKKQKFEFLKIIKAFFLFIMYMIIFSIITVLLVIAFSGVIRGMIHRTELKRIYILVCSIAVIMSIVMSFIMATLKIYLLVPLNYKNAFKFTLTYVKMLFINFRIVIFIIVYSISVVAFNQITNLTLLLTPIFSIYIFIVKAELIYQIYDKFEMYKKGKNNEEIIIEEVEENV